MVEYALRLESGADTAPRVRMGDTLPMAAAGPATAVSGLRPDGGGEVTVSGGTMDVTVPPLLGWIDGAGSLQQGGYPVVVDAPRVVTLDDGDAASDRIDTIVVRVQDATFDNSGATRTQVYAVKGTPGATTPPALPDQVLPLADVLVPAGASAGAGGLSSSNLQADRRTFTAALGGLLVVPDVPARDALTPYPGMPVYRRSVDTLEVYDGTIWHPYQRGDLPAWSGEADAAQTIPSGVGYVDVTTITTRYSSGGVTLNGGTGEVTVPQAGLYSLSGHLSFETGPAGDRYLGLVVNGSFVVRGKFEAGALPASAVSRTMPLAAGDTVKLQAWQDSGSGLDTVPSQTGLSVVCERA